MHPGIQQAGPDLDEAAGGGAAVGRVDGGEEHPGARVPHMSLHHVTPRVTRKALHHVTPSQGHALRTTRRYSPGLRSRGARVPHGNRHPPPRLRMRDAVVVKLICWAMAYIGSSGGSWEMERGWKGVSP